MTSHDNSVIIIGGGQSGLAAARAALEAGLRPTVLEAGDRPVGSWPHYYDSLTLFSPVRFNTFCGERFPGVPEGYPARDEVVGFLHRFADGLDAEIRTGVRVTAVEPDGAAFMVRTESGEALHASAVIAASGSFGNPYVPVLPGAETFTGEARHVAEYRSPDRFAGRRVVIVGGGNSAVQVGYELARVASTTLATRRPLQFWAQNVGGKDIHHRLVESGFDDLPPEWLAHALDGRPVMDTGPYRAALETGVLDRRPMFTAFDEDAVVWADGTREHVDAVLYATGYLPGVGYLAPLGAVSAHGLPLHAGGISTTHPGLAYVGLEFQRSFSSNTLRGVYRDAQYVMAPLAAHVRGAAPTVAAHAPAAAPAA